MAAAIGREFAALWESGEIVGAGPVADRAVRRLIAGAHWQDAAILDDLPLNRRCHAHRSHWPLGLRRSGQPRGTTLPLPASLRIDIPSPSTPRSPPQRPLPMPSPPAQSTCLASCTTLPAASRAAAQSSAERIRQVQAWLELPEDEALQAIASTAEGRIRDGFGIPALAEPTVLAALYAFLKAPTDFVATIDIALRIGGDVDTIGAIAGRHQRCPQRARCHPARSGERRQAP